jgi:hypothetical protein
MLQVAAIDLTGDVMPGHGRISLAMDELPQGLLAWPSFHNGTHLHGLPTHPNQGPMGSVVRSTGVAAALRMASRESDPSNAWLPRHRVSDLEDTYAGFLLGISLNGHLHTISRMNIYNYLAQVQISSVGRCY